MQKNKLFNMHQMQRPSLLKPLFVTAMIGSGEIGLNGTFTRNRFCIFYYNLDWNIITTVSLRVVPEIDSVDFHKRLHISKLIENAKLM